MKFSGKELFELGVPQNKIKLFVGKEFESKEALLEAIKPKEVETKERVRTWADWVWDTFHPFLPFQHNGDLPVEMSKSQLRRIMDSKSLEINGGFPKALAPFDDDILPIVSMVWFPKSEKFRNTYA
jgi:hypothetical protein